MRHGLSGRGVQFRIALPPVLGANHSEQFALPAEFLMNNRLIACILWPLINSFDVSAGEIKTALGKLLAGL